MNKSLYIRGIFCVLLIVSLVSSSGIGQCEINSLNGQDITLEPVDEISLRLLVSDAVIDDLSSAQQGICEVRLEFIHQDVTDLNFTLYSPSGDAVILIGPAEPMGSSLQIFGIAHDISFVPSTVAAMPDAGMPDRWDNRDPDWVNNSAFAGVYYPFGGDLDINFSNGPVEGIWELRLIDQFIGGLDPSSFQNFELIFCDQQLTCQSCEAQSGMFNMDSVTICEGQQVELSEIYTSVADDIAYKDILLAYSGDALFSQDAFPDLEGSFELYVLNVLRSQEEDIRALLNTLNRVELIDLVNAPGGNFCFDLSSDPLIYTISQNTGIQAIIEADQTSLSCEVDLITLDGSTSVVNDSTNFSWFDDQGISISMMESVDISEGGTYRLFVSDNVCADSTSIDISDDQDDVSVEIFGTADTLTCSNEQIILTYQSNFSPSTVRWTTVAGTDLSIDDSLMITSPGTYVVSLSGNSNCQSTDTIIIGQDISEPITEVLSDVITCDNGQVTLRVIDPIDSNDYIWSIDDQNIGTAASLTISTGGMYMLTTISDNGCMSSQVVDVPVDTSTIAVSFPQDTFINCFNESISVDIDISEDIIVTQSIGNAPFQIIDNNHLIDVGGTYRYTINFDNGCVDTYFFEVQDDGRDTIRQNAVIDTLTCEKESVLLSSNLSSEEYSFLWLPNIGDTDAEVLINEPAVYEVTATDLRTGCITTRSFDIGEDRNDPEEVVFGDTIITCLDSIAIVTIATDDDAIITWTTPDMQELTNPTVNGSIPGTYTYLIEGANGCNINGTWMISEDKDIAPINLPDQVTLTCREPELVIGVDTSRYQSTLWQYEGTSFATDSIELDVPGQVILSVIGDNGCTADDMVLVADDFVSPLAEIINSDTTFCSPRTLFVNAIQDTDNGRTALYEWFNSDDELLSEQREFLLNQFGEISLRVSYEENGCESFDIVTFDLSEEPLTGIELITMDESCSEANDGSIDIIGAGGGVGPFEYSLDGELVNRGPISGLPSESYTISVQDANNCILDTSVIVREGDNISVSLPADMAITANETITIDVDIQGDYFDIDWFIDGVSVDASDETLAILIDSDKEVIVQILSNNGCVFTDTILVDAVFTIDQIDLYIPNSFIVDDPGLNGSYYLSLPEEILTVDRFDIYDRWGTEVLSAQNLPGRTRVDIWDGYYNGRSVNPGVFTYICEVTTALDGQKKLFSGTITVLR